MYVSWAHKLLINIGGQSCINVVLIPVKQLNVPIMSLDKDLCKHTQSTKLMTQIADCNFGFKRLKGRNFYISLQKKYFFTAWYASKAK